MAAAGSVSSSRRSDSSAVSSRRRASAVSSSTRAERSRSSARLRSAAWRRRRRPSRVAAALGQGPDLGVAALAEVGEGDVDLGQTAVEMGSEAVEAGPGGEQPRPPGLGLLAAGGGAGQPGFHLGQPAGEGGAAVVEAGRPHLQLGPERDQALGPGLDPGPVGPLRRHPGRARGLVLVEGGQEGLQLRHPGRLLGDAVDGAVALGPDVVDLGRQPAGVGSGGGGGRVELAVAGGGGRRLGCDPGGGGGSSLGRGGSLVETGLGGRRRVRQLIGPGAGLVEGGPGDPRRAHPQPPADGGDAVARPGDGDHVGEGEGDVDRLLPAAVDHDHVGQQVAQEPLHARMCRSHDRPQRAGGAVGREGRGRVEERAQGQHAGRQRPGPVVEQAPAGGDAVDHHRAHRLDHRRLEGGLESGLDVDQVEQGAHHPLDARQPVGVALAPGLVDGQGQGLGPGGPRAVDGGGVAGRGLGCDQRRRRRPPVGVGLLPDGHQLALRRRQPGQLHAHPVGLVAEGHGPSVEARQAVLEAGQVGPAPVEVGPQGTQLAPGLGRGVGPGGRLAHRRPLLRPAPPRPGPAPGSGRPWPPPPPPRRPARPAGGRRRRRGRR